MMSCLKLEVWGTSYVQYVFIWLSEKSLGHVTDKKKEKENDERKKWVLPDPSPYWRWVSPNEKGEWNRRKKWVN